MLRVLSIAGSDSGGGAGIQADLKTIAALDAHGLTAVTALTAQTTLRVESVHPIPPELVRAQIRAIIEDIGVDAVKVGMIATAQIVTAAADERAALACPIVVDPVLVATTGARLLDEDALDLLRQRLLPLATVVTPNLTEASRRRPRRHRLVPRRDRPTPDRRSTLVCELLLGWKRVRAPAVASVGGTGPGRSPRRPCGGDASSSGCRRRELGRRLGTCPDA